MYPGRPEYRDGEPVTPVLPAYQPVVPRPPMPASVQALATAQIVGGAVALLAAWLSVLVAMEGWWLTDQITVPPWLRDPVADVGFLGALGLSLGALVAIALGRRLRRGRQWARLVVIAFSVLNLGATLYIGLVAGGRANALFGLVVPVLYLIGLNTRSARSWFASRDY